MNSSSLDITTTKPGVISIHLIGEDYNIFITSLNSNQTLEINKQKYTDFVRTVRKHNPAINGVLQVFVVGFPASFKAKSSQFLKLMEDVTNKLKPLKQ